MTESQTYKIDGLYFLNNTIKSEAVTSITSFLNIIKMLLTYELDIEEKLVAFFEDYSAA